MNDIVTRGTFVTFVRIGDSPSGKTKQWRVDGSDGTCVGYVRWYAPWRKYSFRTTNVNAVFEQVCLREIAAFVEAQTAYHKGNLRP